MERPITQPGRRVGNTTRLADYYIQLLFKEREIVVIDHHDLENNSTRGVTSKLLIEDIMRRLYLEHGFNKGISKDVKVDINKCTIKLLK